MRKVLFFHPSSELYGADKILVYIIKNYKNFQKILVLKSDGPLARLIKKEIKDIDIIIVPEMPIIANNLLNLHGIIKFILSLIRFKSKINRILDNDIQIIYLNTLAVLPVLFFVKKKNKNIMHIHEILENTKILNKAVNYIALIKSDFLVCVSNAVKNNFTNSFSNNTEKLIVINNGINFNLKNAFKNTVFETNNNKINFALIGRIKPSRKGQNLLIDALKILDCKYLEKSHFYFVGSTVYGEEYMLQEVKNNIKINQLDEHIEIIPFIDNIEIIYNKIDVVLVPSVFEDPFPTTVLEGMFFSKPVIGTKAGGIPEMIVDNETGFICDNRCANDISNKIKFFIENPEKINEFGSKGKDRFLKKFSESSFNSRYIKFIEEKIND